MLININSDKKILPIIYFIIISFINESFKAVYNKIDQEVKLIQSLSQICLIFFYLYEKKILKNEQYKKEYKSAILVFIYLIFIQIFLYINHFLNKYQLQDNDYSFYDITFIILIEIFVFKTKKYIHHIIACVINIIILLIYVIYKFNKLFLYQIIKCYCNSFSTLLIEYLNLNYFINIFLLGFIKGIMELIFSIFLMFYYENFILNKVDIKLIIFIFLINFLFYFLYYKTILKLGSVYTFLCFYTSSLIIYLARIPKIFIEIILFTIVTISNCIYLEIIELNFWGLNKYYKKKIYERAIKDTNNMIKSVRSIEENLI